MIGCLEHQVKNEKRNNIKKFIINSAINGPATNAAGNKDNNNKGILFFSFKIVIINLF